jgi:hypothetical protein
MTIRNARLHQNAIVPVGSLTTLTDNGATTLAVPTGATGIILQGNWASGTAYAEANDGIYWSITAVQSAADQGFSLSTVNEPYTLWFDPVVTTSIYLWLVDNAVVHYQFVAKAGGANRGGY